ncbi:hypothetical protein [Sphingopyxis panaciterrae]
MTSPYLRAVISERLRDCLYTLIARSRNRWFGKADYCVLLTKEQRERLLGRIRRCTMAATRGDDRIDWIDVGFAALDVPRAVSLMLPLHSAQLR